MAISGGADWVELMKPLTDIRESYGILYLMYIFFMYFGVLNVVVGAFVATTADVASRDRDALVTAEIAKMHGYLAKARQFFQEADMDGNGRLSWDEFEHYMQNEKVKAFFQALDLDVTQAHTVFELLDSDESNEVTVDDFIDGCMRLKGQARNVDLNLLLHLHRKLAERVEELTRINEQGFGWLRSKAVPRLIS